MRQTAILDRRNRQWIHPQLRCSSSGKAVHQRKPLGRISSTLRRRSGRNDVILIEDSKTHAQQVDADDRPIPRHELKGTSTRSTNKVITSLYAQGTSNCKEDQEGIRSKSLSNRKTTS